MANLTTEELKGLSEELGAEKTLITKYKAYAEMTSDPTIRSMCESLAGQHMNHFDTLMMNFQ